MYYPVILSLKYSLAVFFSIALFFSIHDLFTVDLFNFFYYFFFLVWFGFQVNVQTWDLHYDVITRNVQCTRDWFPLCVCALSQI